MSRVKQVVWHEWSRGRGGGRFGRSGGLLTKPRTPRSDVGEKRNRGDRRNRKAKRTRGRDDNEEADEGEDEDKDEDGDDDDEADDDVDDDGTKNLTTAEWLTVCPDQFFSLAKCLGRASAFRFSSSPRAVRPPVLLEHKGARQAEKF